MLVGKWNDPYAFLTMLRSKPAQVEFSKTVFGTWKERSNVEIVVRDNNVDQALRVLKKKMQREGTIREMKRRRFYEKPSEKRARQKAEAIKRTRKLAKKRARVEIGL